MQELVKQPFRAEGFQAEMDLLFRFVVRFDNTPFGIHFRMQTARADLSASPPNVV